jgi:hypothetical protein
LIQRGLIEVSIRRRRAQPGDRLLPGVPAAADRPVAGGDLDLAGELLAGHLFLPAMAVGQDEFEGRWRVAVVGSDVDGEERDGWGAIEPAEQLVQPLTQPVAFLPARPQGGEHLGEHGLEQGGVVGQVGRLDGRHGGGSSGTHTP